MFSILVSSHYRKPHGISFQEDVVILALIFVFVFPPRIFDSQKFSVLKFRTFNKLSVAVYKCGEIEVKRFTATTDTSAKAVSTASLWHTLRP